ncbi:MAG: Asp-tRNA(Asn)/Glu-tRNA(Gln) amidotransferase subunit GatA, partial [Acidobacteria bacterium]|nr:Asp-tRNA(Asn)/Glu-tRNA(Gln) amidotransferase subunit GatA [Acidobacteriota bacterium]
AYLTIVEASGLFRRRRLSPVELTRAALRRIEQIDSKLHAFITVTPERALRAARKAEKEILGGNDRGPLHGIPVAVKDTHYTRGIRTTAGSAVLADFIPDFDATVVARLKKAGAVLVGKTNLPEFSFGGTTPASNPWDLSRNPGGSSGGSAIALAAGMVLGATGGDTSGSIRFPATFCGVVGMKPTFGRVSRYGVVPISWSLDHVGPMTRTVHDNALMLNVLAGYDPSDPVSSELPVPHYPRALRRGVRGMRIAIPKARLLDGNHADVLKAFEEAMAIFRKMGARLIEVEMPAALEAMDEGQRVIRIAEAASYHESFLAARAARYAPDSADPEVRSPRRDLEAGTMITAVQYLRSQRVKAIFLRQMADLFRSADILATPGRPAPAGERARVRVDFARMFNCSGFPALALPAGFSTSPPGLPVGLQIAAGPFEEERIYQAAHTYEAETRWYRTRPPI